MQPTVNVRRGRLIAIIIFAVAALNLLFLLSELTINVFKAYFG
jgi:hypothetical protein